MKLLKPRTFVIFALVGLAGAVLLHTSQNVQQAEERLEVLERSIEREEEKTRMLKAEWETLNRPERLERLANEFLDLVPPSPDQMAGEDMDLPEPLPAEMVMPEQVPAPVLQPVSYESTGEAKTAVPVPAPKPKRAIPPAQSDQPVKEKAFGDLLDELGGDAP